MKSFETSICRWKDNAQAALTLSFDGCYQMTYELAMKVLMRYKMPATWFIATGSAGSILEGRPVATWQDLERGAELGMEIASHTVTHPLLAFSPSEATARLSRSILKRGWAVLRPNNITRVTRVISNYARARQGVNHTIILDEAIQSKNMIESQIPSQKVLSFAYPGGRYNSALQKGVREAGYLSARATEDGYNYPNSMGWYALKSKVWNTDVNVKVANGWIDFALEKGTWLIETLHVVSKDGTTGYYYDTAISDFEAHLAYISSQNYWVDTQQNIAKYIKERDATRVRLSVLFQDRVKLVAENDLNSKIQNQALTLRTLIPPVWSRVMIRQAEDVQEVLPVKEEGKDYIYYRVLPNKGEIILTQIR
ncbi:hypothetical protein ES702_02517 [subsurface metagenome]